MIDMPYFMENEAWYTVARDKRGFIVKYTLTDLAPDKARQSYLEYMQYLAEGGDNRIIDDN